MAMNPMDEKRTEESGTSPVGVCPMKASREVPHAGSVRLDREDPAFLAVAHEAYERMRKQGPVVRASFGRGFSDDLLPDGDKPRTAKGEPGSERYFVTRYDEAVEALLDDRLSSDFRSTMTPEQRAQLPFMPEELKPIAYSLLMLDPPDHTRLRKLVQPNFTARAMETLRPRIQRIIDRLLDQAESEAAARGESAPERRMDLLPAFAYPMPIAVISDMLGIPEEDRAQVHTWAENLLSAEGPSIGDEQRRGVLREFIRYLEGLFERKRRAPGEDMISQMAHFQEDGDKLSPQEMMSMVFILFFAGHVTTVNLIGSGVVALLTHPEQLERLLADPSLVKGAVEETLRYWGPVDYMGTPRIVLKDMELAGCPIAQGEKLTVGLASANRDPERFPNPDVFDITRPEAHRNIAFGKGIHVCIGAPLARMEAQLAFETLFRRYPKMRLAVPAGELRLAATSLRGFDRVPIFF
ncbi:cytochrome P450 family protein [Melittangium boletus]|uniref:Cytochrome P450 hydroxylase n=1 Tax=Melittangium boletus DSM 14713 TaxID=1294270 RepID=A0A250IIZ9_9BACT|nr:cytochrome P450 [Melittangium boletus]ATB31200.1 cytochrome P450 hydroxylase [Melittangium boletus DSM 14713]